MALEKTITQEDGIVTNYHRILFVQSTINRQNSIAVLSYVNEASRLTEETGNPYTKSITYEKPYEENMTISDAYEFLKTLPEFSGAVDV